MKKHAITKIITAPLFGLIWLLAQAMEKFLDAWEKEIDNL